MIDNEQLIILLVLFIGFICMIFFIRFWPFKKKRAKTNQYLKFRKLNLLTGEMEELSGEEMRKDISGLMDEGYEMALPDELFNVAKKEIKNGDKFFLILNSNYQHQPLELLTQKLVALNANIIFYRPVIVEI